MAIKRDLLIKYGGYDFNNDELNSSEHFGIHEYYSKLAFNENRLINCQELLFLILSRHFIIKSQKLLYWK